MQRKILAVLLALCLTLGLLPGTARAEGVAVTVDGVEGGQLYFDAQTGTITDCDTSVTVANIPDTINGTPVTSIGSSAFSGCTSLTSITLPNGVTTIGENTFYKCHRLTSIILPDSVTTIEGGTFYGCRSLTSIILPDGLTTIENGTFEGCSSLTSIILPDSVTTIGENAFSDCNGLTSIILPDGLTTIENGTFESCSSLTSIILPDSVTTIGEGTFWNCYRLTNISIPDGVTSIGSDAFYYCRSLTDITLPDGLISIGSNAFRSCSSLTSISIPDGVTAIGNSAFDDCRSLTNITLPNSVATIGREAFYGCNSLTDIILPNGVTTIREWAFSGCSSLTSIILPDSVTAIGASAFSDCNSLTSITIPGGVTTIEGGTFYRCNSLTSITLPDSVTAIGESAFAITGVETITIPKNVAQIGSLAFADEGNSDNSTCPGTSSSLKTIFFSGTPEQWETIEKVSAECFADPTASHGPFATVAPPTIYYSPTVTSEPSVDDNGVTFTISSDIAFNETVDTEDVEMGANTTGLRLESVLLATAARSGNTALSVRFFGQPQGGSLDFTLKSGAFSVPVGTEEGGEGITLSLVVPGSSTPEPAPDPVPDPTPEPDPAPEPTPTPPFRPILPQPVPEQKEESAEDEGLRVVKVEDEIETGDHEGIEISGTGESDMQYIVKDGEFANWIDRVELPQYARDLYTVLCIGGDADSFYDLLINDEYQALTAREGEGGKGEQADVESVLTLTADLNLPYSDGSGIFQEGQFTGGFDIVDTAAGDRAVNYAELKEGDVVRTSAYNGIFVTKILKDGNDNFEEEKKAAATYASTAFQAFDRDYPEVFWLSGKSKLRLVTVTMKDGERQYKETYVFFVLADADGFTVRDEAYGSQAEIEADIVRRDQAVEAVLAAVTGETAYEKAAQLNRWLTEHNEYNTSEDLHSLPNAPHECLSALEGRIGTDGPVCDGYSRAFKVLCGKLEIPCVLVDGYARSSAEHEGEFHMWNSVQMPDGQWYGVDVTWNDPTVKGVSGAKSGHEREDFLLVGADTVVLGLKFSESHPPVNRAANGGVAFTNGPTLNGAAYNPMAGAAALPFTDVLPEDWYYGAVEYAYTHNLMQGTGDGVFSPGESMTRAMVWTLLARLEGAETSGGEPWYAPAQSWAVEAGVSDGAEPDGEITREQLVTMLWRASGEPEAAGSLEGFPDGGTVSGYAVQAMSWAVESGVITGIDGAIQPQGNATRAQVAAMMARFDKAA